MDNAMPALPGAPSCSPAEDASNGGSVVPGLVPPTPAPAPARPGAEKYRLQKKRKELKESVPADGFATGEQWLQYMNAYCELGGRYAAPVGTDFATPAALAEAMALHQHREKHGGVGRMSTKQYTDKDNTKKRAQYAKAKETEEGREQLKAKQKVDDANKAARKERALANGMAWCAHGSHSVRKEDMEFDAVVDLGIEGAIAGKRRHYACIHHFADHRLLHLNATRRERNPTGLHVNECIQGAKKRGLPWELSEAKVEELFSATECYLCQRSIKGLPSFDRVDPWSHYHDGNVQAACQDCNYAKGGLTQDEYRGACQKSARFLTEGVRATTFQPYRRVVRKRADEEQLRANTWAGALEYECNGETWRAREVLVMNASPFPQYKHEAVHNRRIAFELTKQDYDAIVSRPCTYCGVWDKGRIGIDRADSSAGYVLSNVVPCCPTCNFMKGSLSVDDFRALVTSVAAASSSSSTASSSSAGPSDAKMCGA